MPRQTTLAGRHRLKFVLIFSARELRFTGWVRRSPRHNLAGASGAPIRRQDDYTRRQHFHAAFCDAEQLSAATQTVHSVRPRPLGRQPQPGADRLCYPLASGCDAAWRQESDCPDIERGRPGVAIGEPLCGPTGIRELAGRLRGTKCRPQPHSPSRSSPRCRLLARSGSARPGVAIRQPGSGAARLCCCRKKLATNGRRFGVRLERQLAAGRRQSVERNCLRAISKTS